MAPQSPWLAAGLIIALASVATGAALLALAGSHVALIVMGNALAAGLALQILGPARVVLRYFERLSTHSATFRALADLRVWFFRGLARSSAGGLGLRSAADVTARLVADIEALDGLYLRILVPLAAAAMLFIVLAALTIVAPWPGIAVAALFARRRLPDPAARRKRRHHRRQRRHGIGGRLAHRRRRPLRRYARRPRLADRSVAVVGGRNASLNAQRLAAHLSAGLVAEGITVVSGMARGIDAAAHEAVLAAEGCTIAAVAGGLDRPYPPQHDDLQARIAAGGAVVTEAPLGTEPQARHFPRRNRIIAGLSLGVVVAEAARHSGSLITARLALEAGREVFAVPGSPLDPRCQGTNDLIRQGAQLTETIADILAHLPHGPEDFRRSPRLSQAFDQMAEELPVSLEEVSEIRASVLQLLSPAPTLVDDLLRHCQFTSQAAFLAALLDLELGGLIESLPGNRVALIAQQGG